MKWAYQKMHLTYNACHTSIYIYIYISQRLVEEWLGGSRGLLENLALPSFKMVEKWIDWNVDSIELNGRCQGT